MALNPNQQTPNVPNATISPSAWIATRVVNWERTFQNAASGARLFPKPTHPVSVSSTR